jgi:four helix bundle protein
MAERRPAKSKIQSYRDLIVWQRAMALAERVYEVTRDFPKAETYGLTSQMRRAAVSIASNIAEGQGRSARKELLLFLAHARGSLAELGTQVTLSARLGILTQESERALIELATEVGRLLNALRNSLKKLDDNSTH